MSINQWPSFTCMKYLRNEIENLVKKIHGFSFEITGKMPLDENRFAMLSNNGIAYHTAERCHCKWITVR